MCVVTASKTIIMSFSKLTGKSNVIIVIKCMPQTEIIPVHNSEILISNIHIYIYKYHIHINPIFCGHLIYNPAVIS